MNHEERFLAVLDGKIPDKVPYTEIGGMDSVIIGRHYGYDYGKPSKAMDLLKILPGWRRIFLKFAENAKIRLSDFREKVSEDLVSLFSPKLEEIEIEIEAAQKPSAFVHTVEPDKRGKFFNAGDSHADCAYE